MKAKEERPLLNLFLHISKLMNEQLRDLLSEKGIHYGQAHILRALQKNGTLAQKQLALGLHIKAATVSSMVKKMEDAELITRQRNPEDDRTVLVSLTPKGQDAASFTEEMINRVEAQLTAGFTEEEVASLHPPLLRMRGNLGGEEPEI